MQISAQEKWQYVFCFKFSTKGFAEKKNPARLAPCNGYDCQNYIHETYLYTIHSRQDEHVHNNYEFMDINNIGPVQHIERK